MRLTEVGYAVVPLLKLAGLYVEHTHFDHAPPAPTSELVIEPQDGGKAKIVFRSVTAPSCP